MKYLVLIFCTVLSIESSYSQEDCDSVRVIGTIFNKVTFETLPFAVLQFEGIDKSYCTNFNGFFDITIPKAQTNSINRINIAYVGYESESIDGDNFFNGDIIQFYIGMSTKRHETKDEVLSHNYSLLMNTTKLRHPISGQSFILKTGDMRFFDSPPW